MTRQRSTSRRNVVSGLAAAATLTVAVGLTAQVGSTASAAPARTPGATLSIVDQNVTGAGKNRIIIYGLYPMQRADAVGFVTHINDRGCGGMHYIVLGDDGKEQYLYDRNFPGTSVGTEGFLRASDRGLEYLREIVVPSRVLDEDRDGRDEIFVRVRFVDGDCAPRVQTTNVVTGTF
ncbi:hypothetical protein [Gordonia sp. OPL2]|uniref:hypothetical protein n=1 Tax=Gordonia sp. OPL2 TaxID=2486274 RepID=UPI0016564679|nr:hypothetical protein [Gordonia sp. OPL2]RPA12655.1 hypothetical protein EEB19_05260 [Gordonia sp. OPL2]